MDTIGNLQHETQFWHYLSLWDISRFFLAIWCERLHLNGCNLARVENPNNNKVGGAGTYFK